MQNEFLKDGKRLHFKAPPIIEAVIAISVVPLPDSVIQSFWAATAEMNVAGYGQPDSLTQHQFELKVTGDTSSFDNSQKTPWGLKFSSADGLHAVQFIKSVFVFSRIGTYDSWEQFRSEAKKIWDIYSLASGLAKPTGVGVRYINKLFIPVNAVTEEYVLASPKLPLSIAPTISEMFMRVGAPILEPPGKFIHSQALLPPEREGFATLLLDNDFQFPVEGKTIEKVWDLIEKVRDIKDHYFCELTTPKLRETFDA